MGFLKGLVNQRKIKVMHGARAKRLINNHRGEVIGVNAQREDRVEINLKAAQAHWALRHPPLLWQAWLLSSYQAWAVGRRRWASH